MMQMLTLHPRRPDATDPPGRRRRNRLVGLVTIAFALIAASCGGTTEETASEVTTADPGAAETESAPAARSPEDEAAANIASLQIADNPLDTQVLNIVDGSVTTVREQVTGDRPVLLWFWAPH